MLAISPADKGGRLYDPPAELLADCAPFHPLELAYRFLLDQGISTLSLGAEQPADLAWAAAIGGPSPRAVAMRDRQASGRIITRTTTAPTSAIPTATRFASAATPRRERADAGKKKGGPGLRRRPPDLRSEAA